MFQSAYYWFGLFFVTILALLPRIGVKAYKFIFHPSDIDRVRYLHKMNPEHDFRKDREQGGIAYIKRAVSTSRGVRRQSAIHRGPRAAMGSRTDMATGVRSQHTGFDFSMEENGVALRRLQSNLSGMQPPEARQHKRRRSLLSSISRTIRRKKVPSTVPEEPVVEESKTNSPK